MMDDDAYGFDTEGPTLGYPGALDIVAAQAPATGPLQVMVERNSDGRIMRKTETEAHGMGKTSYDYIYDEAGRLALVLQGGVEVERYEYDRAGRRIAGTSEAFGMRPATLEYDGMRLTRCGNTTYGYAADGTLRDRHDASGSTWFLYAGDTGLDRAVLPDGRIFFWQTNDATGQPLVKYEGDTPVERYIWRDLMSIERYDDLRRGISQQYHYAEGSRLPHAMTEHRGMQSRTYDLGYDQVGTLKTVAGMDGKLVKQRQYDSFGNMFHDTTPHMFIPIGFAGGVHDRDTGLVRFGRRDYDPQCGRFVAQDPLGDTGGDHDLYEYCVDDPVNLIDPKGLSWIDAFSAGVSRQVGKIWSFFDFTENVGEAKQESEELENMWHNATRKINSTPGEAYDEIIKYHKKRQKYYQNRLPSVVKDGANKCQWRGLPIISRPLSTSRECACKNIKESL